ncbi:MAG TPA: GTPase HflX [Tenuifilaceae bacterium]|nr:GTPase HflX [Tenuifilaceae bacterium]HPE19401.1 GTPase HflX [Tenuifilaceae bacterium]HPQ35559.1 GTPase HflX [Tenuifilaceae bacterium]HRX69185.1 GTPase HflX [Tenuifilaceae bacterium]
MITPYETTKKQETAVLVGVQLRGQSDDLIEDYLDELEFLAQTAGAITVHRFIQRLDVPLPRTFIGTGKVNEVFEYVESNSVDLVIFDDELTATQLRNLERDLKRRVLDRTNLILDIFAQRAKTAYAKTQVELAQYQYLLPRLTRMWTHLERQRGGIGLRGPGETEIETDRRIIRDKISKLKDELGKIDKQMATQRKNRGSMVRVALVGYTNVGKSTLMNLISKSDIFAENKLFATLDTTVRKVVIENLPVLLSDTVGFIRKLPHQLVESFKSTLDEVREADILLHVVDISHPAFEEQLQVVSQTLHEIGVSEKPTILVFNKIDAYRWVEKDEFDAMPVGKENFSLEDLKRTWIGKVNSPSVFISAKQRQNISELKDKLYSTAREIHMKRYPYDHFLF